MIDITLNYTLEEQSSLSMKDYIQLYTTMHIKTNTTSPNTDEKSFKVSKQMDKQREYQLIELKDNHRHIINNESSKTGHYWLTTTTQICPPIKPKDRNLRYYLEFIAYILINYLILNLCILVKRNSSPLRINSWQFTQLSDFNMVMGIMNAFLVLFVVLNLMFSMTFGVIAIILEIPIESLMQNPLLSTSVRDFWSNRWNAFIRDNLKRLAFKPTQRILTRFIRNKKIVNISSAFSAFLLSALLHEFMVHSLLHNSIPFEQSAFFMLHCLATILQVVFTGLISDSVSMIDQILGIDLNKFYVEWKLVKMTAIVGRILTWMFFVWTGGLFFGGLEREGLFWRMIEPVYIPNVIEGIY